MGMNVTARVAGWVERRTLRRWSRLADAAGTSDPETLKRVRSNARALQQRVDRLLHTADGRLALPMVGAAGIKKPLHTDWAWRPELWSGPIRPRGSVAVSSSTRLGSETTLFHDCDWSEVTLRQIRNTNEEDLAPYGARIDVFAFDGSYLSLVVELPPAAVDGLTKNHVVRLETRVATERPLELFARLNVRHGPNTEQVVREVPPGSGERAVEFDLAYSQMNERRVERAWLDLIFERPAFNEIRVRDVTLTRRPRAAL
ncbi:MAG: DUF6478 family protein [Paracoccaceae bacterium]|nr:DUF6478 family protein [Paracoccaceae bacterium]